MAQQTIVAQFDNRSDAQRAMDALVEAGIGRNAIRLLPDASATSYQRTDQRSSYDHTRDEGGFWSSLSDMFLPDEDRYAYAEGMSRGAVTLSVITDEAQADRVADIVERHGAVDMDERETSWRNEGWTGHTAGSAGTTTGAVGAISGATSSGSTTGTGLTGAGAATGADRDAEVIPVVEEQLQVGKRAVEHGRVRVRSYVTEQPVSEQVSLREENVNVERRPVDRPITGADAFQERTIEMTEQGEEAVVSKEARVTEEVVLDKDVEQRSQTVQDTVRRTEVEVEDERTGLGTGTTGTDRDRR